MKEAYKASFACHREAGDGTPRCAELRCPTCWTNTGSLDSSAIQCSRYNHFASLLASSGTGTWKGGDARSAADYLKDDGPPNAWVLGEGGGQDVEVWRGTPPTGGDATASSSVENLSMGKIVYFFKHRGNAREGTAEPGPETWWVLLFEYVSAGSGNARLADTVTQHPVMRLRGRRSPVVFPAENIRRHVHLYHMCPAPSLGHVAETGQDEDDGAQPAGPPPPRCCGVSSTGSASQGGGSGTAATWRHGFKLAERAGEEDKYLLNEHHHSICQTSFAT
ncbi:unnamed protein product [Ectocarpus fasciculatus]